MSEKRDADGLAARGAGPPAEGDDVERLLAEFASSYATLAKYQQEVTILFSDIAGSTAFFEERSNVEGMLLLQRSESLIRPQIERFGGTVVKTIGDAVMASFPTAEEAVHAAVAIQRSADAHNRELRLEDRLSLRMGINTGRGFFKEEDIFGTVVNIAAKVQDVAESGQILLSQATLSALGPKLASRAEAVGSLVLQGLPHGMELFNIRWKEQGASSPRRSWALNARRGCHLVRARLGGCGYESLGLASGVLLIASLMYVAAVNTFGLKLPLPSSPSALFSAVVGSQTSGASSGPESPVASSKEKDAAEKAPLSKAQVVAMLKAGERFDGRRLAGLKLRGADFGKASLQESDLRTSDLTAALFWEASMAGADLGGAHLSKAKFGKADLSNASFRKADLTGANLDGASLRRADLSGADLTGARLWGSDLQGASLRGAKLVGANLLHADLQGADLSGADLSGARLTGANLAGADFTGADLNGVQDLWRAENIEKAKGLPEE